MEIVEVNIKDLNFAEYNPRIITEKEFEGLKNSLKTFGLVEPIIVNKKNNCIVGGHMRTRAWEALGNSKIPVFYVDLNSKQEKKLNVVLNSQAISGKFNFVQLQEILEELKLDEDFEDLKLDELLMEDSADEEQEAVSDKTTFRVFVDCEDELEQEEVFNQIQSLGLDPKIIQL